MTQVEGALLIEGLRRAAAGRGLEIGSGSGRLTPFFLPWSAEVVATDATLSLLRALSLPQHPTFPRVAANVYHLPFSDGSFSAVTMFRVFAFLSDPGAALREIGRVLGPDGVVVLSVEPHPSLGSLLDDLKVGFARTRSEGPPTMTFTREPVVPVRPSAYPAWSSTRAHVRALVEGAGFSVVDEFPCGLEDLVGFRRLPAPVFVGLAKTMSRLGGFPTRILVLRKRIARITGAMRDGIRD
ncbi:MAG: class I SAM-dependent methyltransferase [Thermoplasmata archaeon]|nr:class I SAM-dependent methyltransferase [Thermoplasmata archaeon]